MRSNIIKTILKGIEIMKYTKRILSALIAVIMIAAMSVSAFAADSTYTVTINNSVEGHTYEAYQIFSGKIDALGGAEVLTDIVWGANVDGATLIAKLRADAILAAVIPDTAVTAADVAKAINGQLEESDVAKALAQVFGNNLTGAATKTSAYADGKYTITDLTAGYYLVKDQKESIGTDDNDAYTRFMLKVVSNVTASPKSSIPTVQKFVKDINDSTETAKSDWQKSADHDVNNDVDFRLEGTLPTTYDDYSVYKYVFNDTLDNGFTYNNDAKVYVENTGDSVGSGRVEIDVTPVVSGQSMTVTIDDLKAITLGKDGVTPVTIDKNSKITVEYTAKLDEDAVFGSTGNKGEVELVYSNNPNKDADGNQVVSTGKTPKDTVIVFTYKVIVNKKDDSGNALPGATFELYKKVSGSADVLVSGTVSAEGDVFTFSGLDDGNYVLKETVAPTNYSPIADIEFTVSATHDADALVLTALSGNATTGEATFAADVDAGSLSTDIINNLGASLPETGGMGTVLFYVIGSLLVLGAGVLLVVKIKSNRAAAK